MTIILDNYPPSKLQGVGLGGRKNPRFRFCLYFSGHVRPRQGTEICNFGAPSPREALHWIFCFFSSLYVQFSKTSPLESGESSEKSSGENRVKSCHVCGCHGFFGPDFLFSLGGGTGRRRSPRRKGGVPLHLKIQRGGGASDERRRGGAHRVWQGVCWAAGGEGGGG